MKKLLLLCITILTANFVSAQAIGDTFTDSNIDYKIINNSPFEVEVVGTSIVGALVVPSSVVEPVVNIACSVTRIGNEAFLNNTDCTSIELPSTVTSTGYQSYRGSAITTVSFTTTNSITTFDERAFILSSITGDITNLISSAVSIGNGGFNGCANATSVTTPSTLTSLGTSVFRNAGFETADLSASTSLETLSSQTFRDCSSLTSVVIPSSVTLVDVSAFINCGALTSVQVNNPIPSTVGTNAFSGVTLGSATLTVPAGTTGDYDMAAVWTDFGTITDGTLTLSTNNLEKELGFSIYPNPTTGIVSIKSSKGNNASVSVYDLNGRALLNKNVNNVLSEINISNLANGIYLFKIKTDNSEFTQRIVKH